MSKFSRNIPDGEVLNTLDLRYNTKNQITTVSELKTWTGMMRLLRGNIFIWPAPTMNGYQATPERYWIRTNSDVIMIFVEYDPENEIQRFVWKTPGKDDVVITGKVSQDSIVLLRVQGETLSYANGNKLLFVECEPPHKHPITIAFVDDFGLTQTTDLEIGEWSSAYVAENKFKSISHDITYDLGKIGQSTLTVGDSAIPRELMLYFDGLIKSPAYLVTDRTDVLPTHLTDSELVANNFTKTYSIAGVLQFDTIDIPKLQMMVGEINIHNV